MPIPQEILRVYETGETTVLGFGTGQLPEYLDIEETRDEIVEFLKRERSASVAFDVTGVAHVPSAMLGLWASLRRAGYPVHIYNPSRNVRAILEVTRLCRLFQLHDLVA